MNIEVIKDTKIIENNTKDSLQVKIENDTVIPETSVEIAGHLIKGKNLIVTDVSYANLGNIKARLTEIDEQILKLSSEKTSLLATQGLIEPELDKAITDILKDPTAVDRRTVNEEVTP
jgi:hypothetical protein